METNTNSVSVSPAEDLCLQASSKGYWTKHRVCFKNKTGFNRNLKKGMVYLSLTLFVMFIGIMTLSQISKHEHESSMSSTKSCFDSRVRKNEEKTDQLSNAAETDSIDGNDSMMNCNLLDRALLDERRERVYVAMSRSLIPEQKIFWYRIHSAWKATSLSEIHSDDSKMNSMIALIMMKRIVASAPLKLQNEGYRLLIDLFEEQHLTDQTDKSSDWMCALGNFAENIPTTEYTPALALNAFVLFGQDFNLNYEKIEIEISADDAKKFQFGKFVYRGEKPEKSYVRNIRHILNGIVRLYFKIQNPSAMRIICGDQKMETATKMKEISGQDDIEQEIKADPIYSRSNGQLSARKKRSPILRFENLMDNPNLITSSGFEEPLELYFDKMEVLSAHIDRLHERYMRLNVLDDDYISREFSVESPLHDDNVD